MEEDLQGLVRELRKETCPRRVIDRTTLRIRAETPPPGLLRFAIPAAVLCSLLLCGLLAKWQLAGGKTPQHTDLAQQTRHQTELAQAQTALTLIGAVLRDAGTQSENLISDRALPPLRNSFETAKNKIIRHTEL